MMVRELQAIGVEPGIIDVIEKWGIKELYPPQEESIPLVVAGESIVLSIPTASGKSLVAYIGLVQGALQGRKGIYIVPLRALASEKYQELQQFSSLGVKVGMSIGDLDEIEEGLETYDILVTTSEKADSILRHKKAWGASLSFVAADEIHLMHEDDRGPTMEMLLAMLRKLNPTVQILGLSATINNAIEIADWLGAKLIKNDWRPVELREGVYSEGRIMFASGKDRSVPEHKDVVFALAKQIIDEGGQCLVFVGTRRSAESTARKIAGMLGVEGIKTGVEEDEDVGLYKRLRWCLERGTAFHHAGLDSKYRKAVEDGFRSGELKCLAATPTLAAGINLPARRVVVRDMKRYDPLTGSRYLPVLFVKQACGRAGRPHLDPYGEAILMARSDAEAEHMMEMYILGDSEDIVSKLGRETVLRRHVLGLVASGVSSSREEVEGFLATTFYAFQRSLEDMRDEMDKTLDFLLDNGFLEEEDMLAATPLGRRTSDLYIDPLTSLNYKNALESGRPMTPIGVLHAVASSPDMIKSYITQKEEASLEEYAMEHEEDFLLPLPEDEVSLSFFLRELKTACLLEDWMNEVSEEDMGNRYNVGPGDIHNRVETSCWLLHAFEAVASLLGYDAAYIRRIEKRMRYGVGEELLDLVRQWGIGRKRARTLFKAGYKSSSEVRSADPRDIAVLPGFGPNLAEKVTGNKPSKKKAAERKKNKRGRKEKKGENEGDRKEKKGEKRENKGEKRKEKGEEKKEKKEGQQSLSTFS